MRSCSLSDCRGLPVNQVVDKPTSGSERLCLPGLCPPPPPPLSSLASTLSETAWQYCNLKARWLVESPRSAHCRAEGLR